MKPIIIKPSDCKMVHYRTNERKMKSVAHTEAEIELMITCVDNWVHYLPVTRQESAHQKSQSSLKIESPTTVCAGKGDAY